MNWTKSAKFFLSGFSVTVLCCVGYFVTSPEVKLISDKVRPKPQNVLIVTKQDKLFDLNTIGLERKPKIKQNSTGEFEENGSTIQNKRFGEEGRLSQCTGMPSTNQDANKIVANECDNNVVNVSKELLWGCYKYRKGSLSLSREEERGDILKKMNCSRKLPGAWIIGVKKCGSQTLMGLLDLHPEIVTNLYLSENKSIALNETEFILNFSPWTKPNEMGLFSIVGLQTNDWLFRYVVRKLVTPATRYILILVDPVKRALSDYVHCVKTMKKDKFARSLVTERKLVWDTKSQNLSYDNVSMFKDVKVASTFESSVLNLSGELDVKSGLLKRGVYSNFVENVLELVPREKLFVVDGQEFVTQPWEVLSQLESLLNVAPFFSRQLFRQNGRFFCPHLEERPDADCIAGKGNKKPIVQPDVLKKLENYYRPYNRKLQSLLGEKYSWMD